MLTDLVIQTVATVLGGVILALIFFWWKEKFYRLPSLTGLWTFRVITETTSYNPYREMSLTYLVLLVQEGHRLSGTGEKIKEELKSGSQEFVGKDRILIEISGYVVQHFFTADECIIHIKENGKERNSSTIHSLKIMSNTSLNGEFVSTIATQTGRVTWTAGNSNYSFSRKK